MFAKAEKLLPLSVNTQGVSPGNILLNPVPFVTKFPNTPAVKMPWG